MGPAQGLEFSQEEELQIPPTPGQCSPLTLPGVGVWEPERMGQLFPLLTELLGAGALTRN